MKIEHIDGKVRFTGYPKPSAEIMEQIQHRIGPDEVAIAVPAEDLHRFLKQFRRRWYHKLMWWRTQ